VTGAELVELARWIDRESDELPLMLGSLLKDMALAIEILEEKVWALEAPADMPTVPF